MENSEIKGLPTRDQVPAELKWDIESVFANDEAWEAAFKTASELVEKASQFEGTLGESADSLKGYLAYREDLMKKLDKIFLYSHMKRDEDNANSVYQGLSDRTQGLGVKVGAALAFEEPELLAIGEERLLSFLDGDLKLYERYFHEVLRYAPHTRNKAEEEILALAGDVLGAPRNIFTLLNNADLKFPVVTLPSGEKVEITHGNYTLLLENPDRAVREAAFKGLYCVYEGHKNALATMLAANVKKNLFATKVRNYPSVLESALFGEEIPVAVYESLIAGVRSNLPLFYDYLAVRKKALGVDELHLYDVYTPLVQEHTKEIPYEEAVEIVLEALKPLGEEYLAVAKSAFTDGWVDVCENKGKTSGAYSTGIYESKPFILLNYQPNLNGVFTLAHELGHSMHSYFSSKNQPYVYSDYTIFVAEVASTVNENLLLRYMLNKETDPVQRKLLITHYLDEFRGTVFRQTMFAEFEKVVHEAAEAGEALSCKYLEDVYYGLNKDYFGEGMVVDSEISMEWSRIPHFYRSFYVYKYATSFCAATALAQGILSGDQEKVDAYIGFLSGGSSKTPIELLRGAGVDMEDKSTLDNAMIIFADMLESLKELV